MDVIDRAQVSEELYRRAALQARSQSPASEPGDTYCEDCGAEIPEPRRRSVPGCRRCIDCQEQIERRGP